LHLVPDEALYISAMQTNLVQGIDAFLRKNTYAGKRLGLVTNEAARTQAGIPSRKALLKAGCNLARLFSPEHGLDVTHADGSKVEDQTDLLTGLPVVSLYGNRLKPGPETLQDLDAVLFDIPDVGCRFYTYLWTMTYMMETCTEAGVPFVLLDRPNPIGGAMWQCEGPMLDETRCSSFIGRWNMPIRHGCTPGELAQFFRATRLQNLQLEVIPCEGWNRNYSFLETNHPFTPTSPAIRNAETALLYPGTGLLEGINVNEGRGTAFAFKQTGSPWIDAEKWKQAMDDLLMNGVSIETLTFKPDWGLYAGEACNGLRFKVTDPVKFRPVGFGLQLIIQLMNTHGEKVQPRNYPTVANPTGENHLDRLLGIAGAFSALKNRKLPEVNVNASWEKMVGPYLLY
jgi:uncharacterized protein YbbC (DUF1343 family)